MLQSLGRPRVGHDLVTEQQKQEQLLCLRFEFVLEYVTYSHLLKQVRVSVVPGSLLSSTFPDFS